MKWLLISTAWIFLGLLLGWPWWATALPIWIFVALVVLVVLCIVVQIRAFMRRR